MGTMLRSTTSTVCPDETAAARPVTLDEMYAAYRDRLLRFVLPRLHYDYAAAEDIVQEAFAAALISISGFGARSSPYTWLCSIAQHKIADHYRKRSALESTGSTDLDCDLMDALDKGELLSTVESWCETQETSDAVRRALEKLPPDYERVLRRKYFAGLSTTELSAELGRTPKAVEGLLARARHALSERLAATADA